MSAGSDQIAQHRVPWWATVAMIGSAACWGFGTVMDRDLLDSFTPPSLLVVELIASVAALTLIALPERPLRYWGSGLRRASLAGLLEPGAAYAIVLAGLALTTAGNTSAISATEPLIILVLAWIFLQQRPSCRVLIAIFVAVTGLVMISGESLVAWADPTQAFGDLLVLVSTGFAAAYVVVASQFSHRVPPATMATAQQVVGLGFAIVLLVGLETSGFVSQDWTTITPGLLAYAAVSGIVQYGLAFWLYLIGLKYLKPATAGLWLTLTPVFGIAGAFLWLGEIPTMLMLTGTAIILTALITTRKEH